MEVFLETALGKLYKGDFRKVLPLLEEKRFDLIILDPPHVRLRDERAQSWERGSWETLFEETERLLKDDGIAFLFGLSSFFLEIAEPLLKHFKIAFDLVWVKTTPCGFLTSNIKPMNRHELILALIKKSAKLKDITYNYQEIAKRREPRYIRRDRIKHAEYGGVVRINGWQEMRRPTTVLEFPNKCHMPKEERTPHPTQKPESLIEYLIRGWSNRGERILDPFLGSGTTGVVCERFGRRWIGVEKEERWCKLAAERIRKESSIKRLEFFF